MNIKVLIPIFCAIIIGFLFGKVIFNNYENNTVSAFNEGEKTYFVKAESFENENDINLNNVENYLVLLENNTYNVYIGITKSKDNATLIKDYYDSTFKNIKIEEKYIDNKTFITSLKEYDKVISIITKKEDLDSVLKIINSSYKEFVLSNDNDD